MPRKRKKEKKKQNDFSCPISTKNKNKVGFIPTKKNKMTFPLSFESSFGCGFRKLKTQF
jgi:hypothetical protein